MQESSGAPVIANLLTGLGIDDFLTRTDSGTSATSFFLTDALGSAVALTNSSGSLQTEFTYEPFGKTSITGLTNSSSYQYTGRENDGTGLLYYRNRYYHPELSRFMSEDPIEFESGDTNLYKYVANSPLLYVDPEGLDHSNRLGPYRKLRDACRIPGNCFPPNNNKSSPPPPKPPEPPFPNSPYPYGAPPVNTLGGSPRDPGTGEPIWPTGFPGGLGLGGPPLATPGNPYAPQGEKY